MKISESELVCASQYLMKVNSVYLRLWRHFKCDTDYKQGYTSECQNRTFLCHGYEWMMKHIWSKARLTNVLEIRLCMCFDCKMAKLLDHWGTLHEYLAILEKEKSPCGKIPWKEQLISHLTFFLPFSLEWGGGFSQVSNNLKCIMMLLSAVYTKSVKNRGFSVIITLVKIPFEWRTGRGCIH